MRLHFAGALGPSGATASSHRESPLIADDPAADNTDTYAFVSRDKPNTVTVIANYYPFQEPAGGPLVIGHVAGLAIAHDRAVAVFQGRRTALEAQLPMLGLMVLYTLGGMWLLTRG